MPKLVLWFSRNGVSLKLKKEVKRLYSLSVRIVCAHFRPPCISPDSPLKTIAVILMHCLFLSSPCAYLGNNMTDICSRNVLLISSMKKKIWATLLVRHGYKCLTFPAFRHYWRHVTAAASAWHGLVDARRTPPSNLMIHGTSITSHI